jgi:four helix bundle protein
MTDSDFPDEWYGVGVSEESVPYQVARRFEDLIAWQRARELHRIIYHLTRESAIRHDRDLVSQMRRAAISVMSNIAEGHERSTPREFHRFLLIAKASCGELRSQLYGAMDVGYIETSTFERVVSEAERTGQVIGALRIAVAKRMQ